MQSSRQAHAFGLDQPINLPSQQALVSRLYHSSTFLHRRHKSAHDRCKASLELSMVWALDLLQPTKPACADLFEILHHLQNIIL